MSDFKQAIEWLKEGKKVRRKNEGWYISGKNKVTLIGVETNNVCSHQEMFIGDIEATDWEIFEDRPTQEEICKSHKEAGVTCEFCKKESLSDCIFPGHKFLEELNVCEVREKVQNAQKRLKEEILIDSMYQIDKIFKEEFGDKLIGG